MNISTPSSQKELMKRANDLAGKTLQQLGLQLDMEIPTSITNAKGWTGRLLEIVLGANANTAPAPDFLDLDIELKTIPIDESGKPKESTYVCVVQLDPIALQSWEDSLVKHKLNNVLWIPIEAKKNIPFGLRRIGTPLLWQPDIEQEKQLKEDWQELSDMIVMGEIDKISSSMGKYLQIRPKAANSSIITKNKNMVDNENITLPRGFYLRSSFTKTLIN